MRGLLWAVVSVFVLGTSHDAADAGSRRSAAPGEKAPKNIIVMIGDGLGYNHVAAASLYKFGKKGRLIFERFPVKLAVQTYSASGTKYRPVKAWADFKWVKINPTDSAAAATAISCGVKVPNGNIGVDANGDPLAHALERAEARGKSTGVVTTVPISHATPAGFVAHNISRRNYEQIAREMILSSAVEVIMGAGNPYYDDNGKKQQWRKDFKYVGGRKTWRRMLAGKAGGDADGDGRRDRWTLIQSRKEFRRLRKGPAPKRVIGIARVNFTLQQLRRSDGGNPAREEPFQTPRNKNVPTLSEMCKAALNVLDDDPDGFFLLIEGGAIDRASHRRQLGRMVEETLRFNRAVKKVVSWVERNSDWRETVLIVTADHETGYLTGPHSNPAWRPLKNNGSGHLPGAQWNSRGHTNSLVPLYAKGDAAAALAAYARKEDPVRGAYLDNTRIAKFLFKLLR